MPVSISYDFPLEEGGLLQELLGARKRRESVLQFVSAFGKLVLRVIWAVVSGGVRRPLGSGGTRGRVAVSFAPPIPICKFLKDRARRRRKRGSAARSKPDLLHVSSSGAPRLLCVYSNRELSSVWSRQHHETACTRKQVRVHLYTPLHDHMSINIDSSSTIEQSTSRSALRHCPTAIPIVAAERDGIPGTLLLPHMRLCTLDLSNAGRKIYTSTPHAEVTFDELLELASQADAAATAGDKSGKSSDRSGAAQPPAETLADALPAGSGARRAAVAALGNEIHLRLLRNNVIPSSALLAAALLPIDVLGETASDGPIVRSRTLPCRSPCLHAAPHTSCTSESRANLRLPVLLIWMYIVRFAMRALFHGRNCERPHRSS